jgi:1A family penicillin-binding protein
MRVLRKLFFILKFFFFILGVFFILCLFLVFYFLKDLPRPEFFTEREFPQSTKIFDRTGKVLLYEIFEEEKRSYVTLDKIPDFLKKAVIAAEDANFYKHPGVEPKGILRAILEDLKLKKPLFGGSTITQQLIRSSFLTNEKTFARKTREIILTLGLERKYSKDQILEWYLNQVPFGENAYGVEAASQTYFGKSVSEINLTEAAILASLIKAPYGLSPYNEETKKRLLERKNYVLDRMVELGFISKEEGEKAKKEEVKFVGKKKEFFAPYFVLWVKEILERNFGKNYLKLGGLKVYTTLDVDFQKIAEKVVKEGVERNRKLGAFNSCLVAINPQNGDVLAMTVGTGNYEDKPLPEGCTPGKDCKFDPKVNVCFSLRQPGSAFKPFVYAKAFEKGYSDMTTVSDAPTCFGVWGGKQYCPKNYDGKFRGEVTLREALAQSLNVPSVKVLMHLVGLNEGVEMAKRLGITTLKEPFGPSIVLGGWEVNLVEMVQAYSSFANGGYKIKVDPILKIEDSKGRIIYEKKETKVKVLDKRVADLISDILSDNEARAPVFGWNSPLYFENYKVSVKTGTTQDFRDGWTIGYTSNIVVGVWAGNNDNSPIKKEPGVKVAGPIWHNFLTEILPKIEKPILPEITPEKKVPAQISTQPQ